MTEVIDYVFAFIFAGCGIFFFPLLANALEKTKSENQQQEMQSKQMTFGEIIRNIAIVVSALVFIIPWLRCFFLFIGRFHSTNNWAFLLVAFMATLSLFFPIFKPKEK